MGGSGATATARSSTRGRRSGSAGGGRACRVATAVQISRSLADHPISLSAPSSEIPPSPRAEARAVAPPCGASRATPRPTRRCASTWPRGIEGLLSGAQARSALIAERRFEVSVRMMSMLALLIAASAAPQHLPAAKSTSARLLLYKLDAVGADVGTFEIRWRRSPPGEKQRSAVQLSSRARRTASSHQTSALRRIRHRADRARLHAAPLSRGPGRERPAQGHPRWPFPPQEGTLAVQATRTASPSRSRAGGRRRAAT